jgi:hypothetical protein
MAALERLGPSACHRQSFGPVRRLLDAAADPKNGKRGGFQI